MVRVVIVGTGERAARHLAACRQVPEIEVVAEAGTDNVLAIERSDVAVVDVCAPYGRAAEVAAVASRAGKRVVMEYLPGDMPAGAAVSLVRPERWQPLARELLATVKAGKLGPVRFAHCASVWHWPAEEQEARRAWGVSPPGDDPGSFLVEYASGALDLVPSFFEAPVTRVFARDCPMEAPDAASWYVSVVLFFADASQAICEVGLTSSFAANAGLQRMALTGLRGSAYFNERDTDVMVGAGGVRPLVDDPVEGLAAALADWVAGGGDGVEEGRRTLRLAQAAAESLRTGQPVEVGA